MKTINIAILLCCLCGCSSHTYERPNNKIIYGIDDVIYGHKFTFSPIFRWVEEEQ